MVKLEDKILKFPGTYADIMRPVDKLSGAEKSLIELGAKKMHDALKPRIELTQAENTRLRILIQELQRVLTDALHLGSFSRNPIAADWLKGAHQLATQDPDDG